MPNLFAGPRVATRTVGVVLFGKPPLALGYRGWGTLEVIIWVAANLLPTQGPISPRHAQP